MACASPWLHWIVIAIYIPRIQRGDASFAAKVLGARGALLAVLADFFEQGRWGVLAKKIVEGEKLSVEDQVFVLMQAALYLTPTRDWSVEARNCWEQTESLCRSLNSASPAVRSADGPVAHFQQH